MAFRRWFLCLIAFLGVTVASSSERILFNFGANEPAWGVINDGVMGGVSSSTVRVVNGVLVFSGRVRLENNGGFASNRSSNGKYDLENFDGVMLRVRGDGKKYALNISTTDAGRVLYRAGFTTRDGEWQEVKILFSSLVPTRFGNTLEGPPFQRNLIESFGFIIANKRAEDFKLELDWIKAFKN
jgi:NADH dehydrogenase [ubiquinone] 1 alpha subcomplex assembly factor 1